MQHKNIAIWVLSFSLLGAISEVPGLFLNQVLGGTIAAGCITFVVCCIVSVQKNKKKQPMIQKPIIVCTSATRPVLSSEPLTIFETDTQRRYHWTGRNWVEVI